MTEQINQANKKWTIFFRLCFRQEIAMKNPNSAKTDNINQNHTKLNFFACPLSSYTVWVLCFECFMD